jgi:hypothetical protein
MSFHSIEETVPRRLGHLVNEKSRMVPGGVAITMRHLTYPIVVHRPAEGATKIRQFCPVCKSSVELWVASARRTRLRQRAWLIVGIAAAGLVASSLVAVAIRHFPNASPWYAGVAFGGFATFLGLAAWLGYDGISVAQGGPNARRLHKVFPPETKPQTQPRFRPVEMSKPPVPVLGAALATGLVAVALLADAISRMIAGAGPVPAPYAIFGALVSGLTALGIRRGGPVFRFHAVFWGLVFLVAALGHRTASVWGSVGLAAAALWVVAIVLVLVPRSSRGWFRPHRPSARQRPASPDKSSVPSDVRQRMAHHPVYGLRAGMDRASVLARLGPPTRSVTIGELIAAHRPVIAGDPPNPNDEGWFYEDEPPGHTLDVVISGGVLDSVDVEVKAQSSAPQAADSSGGGTGTRMIRIDKDGIFAWTPAYAVIVLMAIVREVPPVDAARLQREYEDVRQTWREASLDVLPGSEFSQVLQADLARDAASPGYIAFTVAAMADHACGQLLSLIDRPGMSFGSGMAYRVWRTVRDGQGQLAVVRSHEVIRSQPSGDQSSATENRSASMDDERTAHRLTELVAAHERLYELTRDKRLIKEAMDGRHLDSVLSSGTAAEGWISAAVEIRAIGHRLNREGSKRRMQAVAERAAELRKAGDILRLIEVFWDRIGDWRA